MPFFPKRSQECGFLFQLQVTTARYRWSSHIQERVSREPLSPREACVVLLGPPSVRLPCSEQLTNQASPEGRAPREQVARRDGEPGPHTNAHTAPCLPRLPCRTWESSHPDINNTLTSLDSPACPLVQPAFLSNVTMMHPVPCTSYLHRRRVKPSLPESRDPNNYGFDFRANLSPSQVEVYAQNTRRVSPLSTHHKTAIPHTETTSHAQ